MIEYQSREFCKNVGCGAYKDHKLFGTTKESLKTYCNNCGAYKFHKWLQNNDYKILKEEKND